MEGFFPRKQFLKNCRLTAVKLFRRKHTRTVIPNAQISPGRVMAYWSDSMFSGASQFHEPPRGRSTVMLNEELAKCEWPKSVRSARPSAEISTFICQTYYFVKWCISKEQTDIRLSGHHGLWVLEHGCGDSIDHGQCPRSGSQLHKPQHRNRGANNIPRDADQLWCPARNHVHCPVTSIQSLWMAMSG